MSKFASLTRRFAREDDGATLLEYGMLVLLIAVLSIVAVKAIGGKISTGFSTVNGNLP